MPVLTNILQLWFFFSPLILRSDTGKVKLSSNYSAIFLDLHHDIPHTCWLCTTTRFCCGQSACFAFSWTVLQTCALYVQSMLKTQCIFLALFNWTIAQPLNTFMGVNAIPACNGWVKMQLFSSFACLFKWASLLFVTWQQMAGRDNNVDQSY